MSCDKIFNITKDEFKKLSTEEQNILLFERQEALNQAQETVAKKIKTLEELEKKFKEFYEKVKPIIDKFPSEKFKSIKDGLFSKIKKN